MCPYCDFAVAVRKDPPHQAYADALIAEWDARRWALEGRTVRTVYLGGGTPGMWEANALRRFFEHIRRDAGVSLDSVREVTIEANPYDVERSRLDHWAMMGVNRLSIGVQSFDDRYLSALGRNHDGMSAQRAVQRAVGDGRFRVSIDLIYDGPGHNLNIVEGDVDIVGRLRPDHLSAYELTIEPDTVFARRRNAGELDVPDDESTIGDELRARLAHLGYERYEVSNLGRDGDYSHHNTAYWSGWEYIGLGTGAHSFWFDDTGPRRRANTRSLRDYLADPLGAAEEEGLSALEHLGERLFLSARTLRATGWAKLRSQFRGAVRDEAFDAVERVVDETLAPRGLWRRLPAFGPTAKGLGFADWIGGQFWDVLGELGAP